MSKEQIEKIAAILLETSRQNSIDKSNNKSYTVFDADTIFKYGCDRLNGASAIYNAGYREQREGAWMPWGLFDDLAKCSECGFSEITLFSAHDGQHNYCPNCGAKMKK